MMLKEYRTLLLSGLSLLLLGQPGWSAEKTVESPLYRELPLPVAAAAWSVTADPTLAVQVATGSLPGGIKIQFAKPAQEMLFTVKMQQPVKLQKDARRCGIWCYSASRFWGEKPALRFLLEDADGIAYSYQMYGASPKAGSWSYLETPRFWTGELGRLDETMILVEGGLQHRRPVPPLRLVGFEFRAETGQWIAAKQEIEFSPVCSDGVRREASPFYWQTDLGDRYLFGEMPQAARPFVMVGDLLTRNGDFTVTWQARNQLAATRAVAEGTWDLGKFDGSTAARFQRLEIPVTAQGQYWLSFDIREKGGKAERKTVDSWFKVIRGDQAKLALLNAEKKPAGGMLLLNPQRASNLYAPGEIQTCRVRVWQPEAAAPKSSGSGSLPPAGPSRSDHSGADNVPEFVLKVQRLYYPKAEETTAAETVPVTFVAGAPYADVSLPLELTVERPLQKLTCILLRSGVELDRIAAWLGTQEQPTVLPWTNRDSLLRYADIFGEGKHLLSCAEWDARYTDEKIGATFEEWVLDVKRQNVNAIELFPAWREIEPQMGVYWWTELDRRIELVAKHGLKVMLNLDSTYPPEWMPSESQADEEGMVNGLWHGGGNNVLKSPCSEALWEHYRQYLTHLSLRYRNQPVLVAYSSLLIFFDHFWADHPWQGQYVDYSESAKAGFHRYLRDSRGFSLADLSQRWKRPLASWDEVVLPRTDLFLGLATIDRPDPRPEWRDFLDFRRWCQDQFVTKLVAGTVRQYDDIRPIGFHGNLLTSAETYRAMGLYVCAGGSEGSIEGYRKPFDFPKRSESILMSFYTPSYTAMSMTNLLGQGNVHVQNFWMPWWRWESSVREDRKTGTQALAGWFDLFKGDLGQAVPVHAESAITKPLLGRLYSRASILYGVRSFHWFRLDDYKVLAGRACPVPSAELTETVTAAELAALPCVIVDPTARILPQDTIDRLAAYVRAGGKLVMAPTSGMYTENPADGQHVLRRALGLPEPSGNWLTAKEIRQPGEKYTPYYPWEITGRGTPGEQSLSEPGQTARAQAAAGNGVFVADRRLVFRLGAYSMYNRDTWGDWSHMLPSFIYGRYLQKKVAADATVAAWTEGGPAVTLHKVGAGQVLLLWGTPDWYNWREALGDLAAWAKPVAAESATAAAPAPYRLAPETFKGFILTKDKVRWAVIRNEGLGWTGVYGDAKKQADAKRDHGAIMVPNLSGAKYRVTDQTPLLGTGFDQVLTREQLATAGITADLIPGETRIFRLDPVE